MTSSNHIVIAGTGRSGTTFLVEFLAACGLDTGATATAWDARARAGLEHALDADGIDLPYVVKDAWLWVYCEHIDLTRRRIDALVVPVRDLTEAAASRVLQERAAIAETAWIDRDGLGVYAQTAGGVVYSLSVTDQSRILAVGFHRLLHWAVRNDITTVLLDFPRIVEDPEYLVSRLAPVLAGRVDQARALAAHAQVADQAAARVGTEVAPPQGGGAGPSGEELDRAAIVIRTHELECEVDVARHQLAEMEHRLGAMEQELATARALAVQAADQFESLLVSRSWRLTRPLRAIRRGLLRR